MGSKRYKAFEIFVSAGLTVLARLPGLRGLPGLPGLTVLTGLIGLPGLRGSNGPGRVLSPPECVFIFIGEFHNLPSNAALF